MENSINTNSSIIGFKFFKGFISIYTILYTIYSLFIFGYSIINYSNLLILHYIFMPFFGLLLFVLLGIYDVFVKETINFIQMGAISGIDGFDPKDADAEKRNLINNSKWWKFHIVFGLLNTIVVPSYIIFMGIQVHKWWMIPICILLIFIIAVFDQAFMELAKEAADMSKNFDMFILKLERRTIKNENEEKQREETEA